MALTIITVDGMYTAPYAQLAVSSADRVTGSNIDFEAYKQHFDSIIKPYANRIGGYDIDLTLVDNNNGTGTVQALITFENMTDACYFSTLWPDGPQPAFCAVYQPLADPATLNWA